MDQHLLLVILMSFLPPKLTVNPLVIRERDSVTLNCQTPSSVSVDHCQFFTLRGQTLRDSSCLQTLTGTELLVADHQRLPAKVEVTCFYTVKLGEVNSPSPHSETLSISINSLLQPKLTLNSMMITETDSVTLNCQTPSTVPVTQCYFYFVRGKPSQRFSCLKTLTGSELLMLSLQNVPAEVEVTCFYLSTYQSPESHMLSITIQPPRPKLTMTTSLITEDESVTLNCQTPSSVSVLDCFFYSVREQSSRRISCVKTLTGAELLKMTHQNSPAEVEIKCYYTVKLKGGQYQSPDSKISSITIRSRQPQLIINTSLITETDSVTLKCQTPSSVSVYQCHFHIVNGGNFSDVCLQTLTGTELLNMAHQSPPAEVKVTCVYTVKLRELNFPSPYSEAHTLTIHLTDTATQMSSTTSICTLTSADKSMNPTSSDSNTDSEKLKDQKHQNEDSETYHVYVTIPEEPAESVLKNTMYSFLQAH
ncbi:hypothetical protein EXN66_Car005555 [Channa argus]|uniref:Ig-like domain-containing protein n=1 Tax=Channa argus TaxID=215402 RepID=A0A6G1PI66_CHAAH|nr:hypothetical protein EXN66_Car005555 [Channa argus]